MTRILEGCVAHGCKSRAACRQRTFTVDLGTAQGDTLLCIVLDIYVDDLLREVDDACPGVPLPMVDGTAAPTGSATAAAVEETVGSPQRATTANASLTALMFADDFTGAWLPIKLASSK
jgi:hypothetical protein